MGRDGQTRTDQKAAWWPFSITEVEIVIAVYGALCTALTLYGIPARVLAISGLPFVALAYLAGLLAHTHRRAPNLRLLRNGATSGFGHIAPFRQAKRSLFLMHLDDDAPSEELLALYRRLLDNGIEVRRIIFLREDAAPSAYKWIVDFGDHRRLEQRVVLPDQARAVRFSFVLVDDDCVALSVPGADPIDGEPYSSELVLRHLLLVEDAEVAAVFSRVHEETWTRALPLESASELSQPEELLRKCERQPAA